MSVSRLEKENAAKEAAAKAAAERKRKQEEMRKAKEAEKERVLAERRAREAEEEARRQAATEAQAAERKRREQFDEKVAAVTVTEDRFEVSQKIHFLPRSNVLDQRSYEQLDLVADALNKHRDVKLMQVSGHTNGGGFDAQKQAAYRMRLSQQRAEAVVKYLVDKGKVRAERLVAKGFGDTVPLGPNDTDEDKANNRRVEFEILDSAS